MSAGLARADREPPGSPEHEVSPQRRAARLCGNGPRGDARLVGPAGGVPARRREPAGAHGRATGSAYASLAETCQAMGPLKQQAAAHCRLGRRLCPSDVVSFLSRQNPRVPAWPAPTRNVAVRCLCMPGSCLKVGGFKPHGDEPLMSRLML